MNTASWLPRQLLTHWLNLALTVPLIYQLIGLPLTMREHDWSGTQIGLMQMTGVPFVLAMSVSLFGTWVDMPVNALTIRILPQTQHMQAGAIRSTATCLGAIVGGGLMLILYNHMGWASPFYAAGLNTPPPRRPRHVDATDKRPAMAGVVLGAPAPRLDRTTDILFPVDRHRMGVPQTTEARPGFQPGTHCTVGRRGRRDSGCCVQFGWWLHIVQMGSTRCVAFV
ncbi:hypothetical protein [Pseudomonas lini]|uniref:hypothetical protein n=1 Tax=Pseudomonas lini TaxID=163011 RepID=UPI0012E1A5CD|nr:hypothetical protein [Pseudomonas lini]